MKIGVISIVLGTEGCAVCICGAHTQSSPSHLPGLLAVNASVKRLSFTQIYIALTLLLCASLGNTVAIPVLLKEVGVGEDNLPPKWFEPKLFL